MGKAVGDRIRQLRLRRGLTQEALAAQVCRSAGLPVGSLTNQDIYRYESGRRTPRDWMPAVADALGVSIAFMIETPQDERLETQHTPLPALHRATGDRLAPTIRELNRRLIVLDNELHGLPIAETAARAFKIVYRRLGAGGISSAHERGVQAAAAELAEIAGWALFNEGRPKDSRRFSQEALLLARMAGDRGIELLTLQNLALISGWTGRPREELNIAQTVIEDGRLQPAVEAMFRAREGQGLGRTGDYTRSEKSFSRARSLLQEAPPTDGPAWAWWVSGREIDRQHGRVLSTMGRYREAIPVLQRAADDSAGVHVGYEIGGTVWLLDCFLSVKAWGEARATAEKLSPAVGEMSSRTAMDNLERVVSRDLGSAPTDLRDAVQELKLGIEEDPYDF